MPGDPSLIKTMSRVNRSIWILIVLVFGSLIWIWSGKGRSGRAVDPLSGPSPELELVANGQQPGSPRDPGELERATVASEADRLVANERGRIPASERRGLVLTEGGEPVAGAQVSLTWPTDERINLEALEQARRWSELAGVSSTTDESGRFLLSVEPDDERIGVLWVTALGYRAEHRVLGPGQEMELAFTLSAADGLDVIVVDGEHRPVHGAQVVSVLDGHQAGELGGAAGALARAALIRIATTDEQGRCKLPALPGEQSLRAQIAGSCSTPWTGRAPKQVRLVLAPTFQASGRVLRGQAQVDLDETRVSAHALIFGQKRVLDRGRVAKDGTWGPLTLPVVGAEELVLRLEGGRVVPIEARRPMARPGDHISVDFEPTQSFPVLVLIQDVEESPVSGAWVMLFWREGADWNLGEGRTDGAGLARIDAIKPGDIWIRVKAPHYLEFNYGPIRLDEESTAPFLIDLQPAGRVSGRVLLNGEPVPEFRVTHFSARAKQVVTSTVLDEPNGEFEIMDAPLGETILFAAAPGLTPSEPLTIEVGSDVPLQVDLHLRPPRSGEGRVVDALSGQPVNRARIESWIQFENRWLAGTRLDAFSDSNGYFVFPALRPEGDHLDVRAEGYGPRRLSVRPGFEDPSDLGTIALAPAQALKVALDVSGLKPETCRARLVAQREHPWRNFGSDGVLEFEDVVGGHVQVWVQTPAGVEIREDAYLTHGEEWIVHVELEDPLHSGLEVVLDEEASRRKDLQIRSMTSLGLDRVRERLITIREGRGRIPGPLGEELTLEIQTDLNELLCVHHVRAEELRAGRVALSLEPQERRIRVIDRKGDAVARVTATLTIRGDRSHWRSQKQADDEGRVRFLVPPGEQMLLHLRPAQGGGMTDIVLPLAPRAEEEFQVVLDVPGALEVEIHDGDTPLSGVIVSILSASGFRFASLDATDADGRAVYESLAPGSYLAEVAPPGTWQRYVPVEIGSARVRQRIDLRRLGAVALEVRSSLGPPVANATVHLESLEFGEQVANWIAQGRVRSPAAGLTTDFQGRLSVLALPNGPYRYRVTTPDGREAQGQLVVPAHAVGAVVVVVE